MEGHRIEPSRVRPLLNGQRQNHGKPPMLADDVWIGDGVVIGGGTRIAAGAILDHHVIVEQDVSIGPRSLVCYAAQICESVSIGADCVIGGFIGERSIIGDDCRVFGSLVHKHPRNWIGWDECAAMVDGPRLGDGVFVAFGAVIVGDVAIGDRAYIGVNAVVTVDVPADETIGPLMCWSDK